MAFHEKALSLIHIYPYLGSEADRSESRPQRFEPGRERKVDHRREDYVQRHCAGEAVFIKSVALGRKARK